MKSPDITFKNSTTMSTDPRVCVPPLLSDLSLLYSPPSLLFKPSDCQILALLLWVIICYPQWKLEAFTQKVATLDLWLWCLPPCCSPPFSVSKELHNQVEKMGAGRVYSYSETTSTTPIPPKRENDEWTSFINNKR